MWEPDGSGFLPDEESVWDRALALGGRVVQEVRRRRVIQYLLVYSGAGWLGLQGVDQLVGRGLLSEATYRVALVAFFAGIVATSVIAWFHGSAGPQRMYPLEVSLLAALAVAAGGAGIWAVNREPVGASTAPARSPPTPRQVTFDGQVQQAVGSPSGAFVAYLVESDGQRRIFLAEGDGASRTEVFRTSEFACCISWSPDGSRILIRDGEFQDGTGVLVPRLDPEATRRIPTSVITDWSPDGRRVVGWWPAAEKLWFVDVEAGAQSGTIELAMPHDWVQGVDWSPDGRHLAVMTSRDDDVASELWLVSANSGERTLVHRDSLNAFWPHWSGDGSAIYYLRSRSELDEIWKLPVFEDTAAGDPTRVAAGLSAYAWNQALPSLTISADGDRLHYVRWTGHANIVSVDLSRAGGGDGGSGERELPGSARSWITAGTARRQAPRFSPEGDRLTYLEQGPGGWNVWLHELEGDERRQLTFFETGVSAHAWSPEGDALAFGAVREGRPGIWILEIDTGRVRRVGGDRYGGFDLYWMSSGRILYHQSDQQYRLLDPETGEDTAVSSLGARQWAYDPRPAPDGGTVAFRVTGDDEGLWTVDLEDGRRRRMTSHLLGPVGWSSSGDTIYAVPADGRDDASRELWAVAFPDGEAHRRARLPPDVAVSPRNATLHPTDPTLVASAYTSSTDVWLLEGFDPVGN